MALLFTDGFDAADIMTKWHCPSTLTTSTTTRFGYGRSGAFGNSGRFAQKLITPSTTVTVGFAYYTGATSQYSMMSMHGDGGAVQHVILNRLGNGTFTLLRGGATLATSSAAHSSSTWTYLEFQLTVADSGGRAIVKMNGVTIIDFTGDTKNGDTGTDIDAIQFMGQDYQDFLIDDVYACNSLGTANNDFLGDIRVQILLPTATGSSTQLTPTGVGNNWDNVNDAPANTATYNASSLPGQRDTYAMGDLLTTTGQVFGIQETVMFLKTDAGSASMKAALKSGSALVYDPTQILTPSALQTSAVRETDPDTSAAWDVNGVNAIEFGAEVV